MIAMTPESVLLTMWIAFTGVALAGILSVVVWAVRAGQFANQDRARYLPLESAIPDGRDDRGEGVPPLRVAGVLPATGEPRSLEKSNPSDNERGRHVQP